MEQPFIVCVCNWFDSDEVKSYLNDNKERAVTVRETYNACSGGKEPNCEMCVRHKLKDMVEEHNGGIKSPLPPPLP